jgi:hypothetical protein
MGDAIVSYDLPHRDLVQAVEGLLKVNKDHITGSISHMGLLQDIPQDEDMVDARFGIPKACLLL